VSAAANEGYGGAA